MAGNKKKKEAAAAAARKWMMRPCTAAKSTEGAVAGGHGPVTRPLSMRKAVAGSSGEQRPEGSLDLLESARREAAIDKMLGEAKLSAVVPKQAGVNATVAPAAGAAQGGSKSKRRLTKSEVMTILALKPEPFPSADYLDCLADCDPPELIAEKKRQHEEDAAYLAKMDVEFEVFRQKVIDGLNNYGYYEVDEEVRDEANEDPMRHPVRGWADMDPSERSRRIATPEEEVLLIGNGYIRYVPDEDETALINLGGKDYAASDDDYSASDGEADAHKRPHLIESN